MRRSVWHGGIAALAIAGMATAASADDGRSISLPAQPLSSSLQAIARRFGIELLFSQETLAGRSAPAISGRFSAQQALDKVLAGSGLAIRKTADESYLVVNIESGADPKPEAIPDILVIGRRTQNADIRRTQNDVRPYQVVSREQIATSHIATVEELAAKRLPANAQGATLSQQGINASGETASSINLFGLGTAQTLILVDGRRLPQMPDHFGGFLQSDVNAISPEAIDRVEAITATAGGIYGPGATAGVVNLVLQRDYRGIDVAVTNGVTARGDAPYRRVNARVGFTPDHGATDVMIGVSRSNFAGVKVGDRDYLYRANARSFANEPDFTIRYGTLLQTPSLNIVSSDASPLVFKPAFGGAALGSYYTYLAPADGRASTALRDELAKDSGSLDLRPSASRSTTSLLSGRQTTSIVASARHRSGGVELFADYLRLTNEGHAVSGFEAGSLTLAATDARNPFTQDIKVYPPGPTLRQDFAFRTEVTRATGGLIVDLPGSWRGNADYSFGSSIRDLNTYSPYFTVPGFTRYVSYSADPSTPSPLTDYSAFVRSFEDIFSPSGQTFRQRNRFADASFRVAGPVVRLGGGNLTATLLAEQRSERVDGGLTTQFSGLTGVIDPAPLAAFAQTTRSAYAEVRLPLFDDHSRISLLRGLEVQVAVRHDRANTRAPQDNRDIEGGGSRTVGAVGTVYTAGAKVSPITGIMLRGSISTGEQPLTVDNLLRYVAVGFGYSSLPDKKRGNQKIPNPFDYVLGGPPNPEPERAKSISAGVVVEPLFAPKLRIALDYIHIATSRAVVSTTAGDVDFFIKNEDSYPGRVTRLPLTAEDIALGYTGGVITRVDRSSLQTGGTIVDTVTGQLDYRLLIGQGGAIDLRGSATWQPRFTQRQGLGLPDRIYRNTIDGAVTIRGNAGARWTKGPLSMSIDGQFTGPYRSTEGLDTLTAVDESFIGQQGRGGRIPALVSIDLGLEYRFILPQGGLSGRPRTLEFRLGVQDAFDSRPATVVRAPGYYNSYGDPRRRRFELMVAAGL